MQHCTHYCNFPTVEKSQFFTQKKILFRCPRRQYCNLFHPCAPQTPGAIEISGKKLPVKDICLPMLTWCDILSTFKTLPKSVQSDYVQDLITFGKKFNIKFGLKKNS